MSHGLALIPLFTVLALIVWLGLWSLQSSRSEKV
ncbi:hypothetical protein OICFNHDK_3839 [Methylobacterium bullatum]|uniref:Uncharacterized protein n=1 Tax=Methylobacterium bullatum TaxID=570505 RepID=A0AAV4ZBQ3_9HYPH|nr:hypothetical protein OICFNHDK_3839 [Methylobacterium bullatum]